MGSEHERDAFARRALYQKLKGLAADDRGPGETLRGRSINLPVSMNGQFREGCCQEESNFVAFDLPFSWVALEGLKLAEVVAVPLCAFPRYKGA